MTRLKTLLLVFVLPVCAFAAPVKQPVWTLPQLIVLGSTAAGRTLDWTSTEQCLRRPYAVCHEKYLPKALVQSKPGFAIFEAGTFAITAWSQYELIKHGHRKLAFIGQLVQAVSLNETVVNNYRLASNSSIPFKPVKGFEH